MLSVTLEVSLSIGRHKSAQNLHGPYFLSLPALTILKVSKLLLGESTCYHAYVKIEHRQIILPPPSKQGYVAS